MTLLNPFERGTFTQILSENCFVRTFFDNDLRKYTIRLVNRPCKEHLKYLELNKIESFMRLYQKATSKPNILLYHNNKTNH